ncbi:MAG: hypothetical protein AAF939_15805 [Planctomycetota bacterium]
MKCLFSCVLFSMGLFLASQWSHAQTATLQSESPYLSSSFRYSDGSLSSNWHVIDEAVSESRWQEDQEAQPTPPKRPAFGPWPLKGIREIGLDVRDISDSQPEDRSAQLVESKKTSWTQFAATEKVFAWMAPNIRYQPLYFEDVALERYGQTLPAYRQSVKSGIHFFKSMYLLPHQIRKQHPLSCDSPLGFCRPGNCVDYTIQRQKYGPFSIVR